MTENKPEEETWYHLRCWWSKLDKPEVECFDLSKHSGDESMTDKDEIILGAINEFERRFAEEARLSPNKVEPLYELWRHLRSKLLMDLSERMEAEDERRKKMSRAVGSDAAARRA